MHSFRTWFEHRPEEAPAAERLAMLIAQAGAAGVSLDRLRRIVGLTPEKLQDVLRSLTATGQVTMLRVNGQLVYRAAG
jgi:hypothetical protein